MPAEGPAASPDGTGGLEAEDAKLVTLARAALGRLPGASAAAAVRDATGRAYVAADVSTPSLVLDAAQTVVAMAVSSGSQRLEAAAVVRRDGAAAAATGGPLPSGGGVPQVPRVPQVLADLAGEGFRLVEAAADGTVLRVLPL